MKGIVLKIDSIVKVVGAIAVILLAEWGMVSLALTAYPAFFSTPASSASTPVKPKIGQVSTGSANAMIKPRSTDLLHGEALLKELQSGGLILFFRHFQTDHRKWHEDPIKTLHYHMSAEEIKGSCDRQRALTDYGRLRARLTGENMRKLNIPVVQVLSSPYCRTIECATLLAGRPPDSTPKELLYRGGDLTKDIMVSNTIPLLTTPPKAGGNAILVAHRTQMDDIHFIEEGQAFIFRPDGKGNFDMVGSIFDSDWTEAVVHPELLGTRYVEATLKGSDAPGGNFNAPR